MTGLAKITGIDMRGAFTGGDCTIVTTKATADNFIMIHIRWCYRYPGSIDMTGFAKITGGNVGRTFTRGNSAIVTAKATANDFVMIH